MKVAILGGLLIALALAIFLSPFASSSPDGLEKVAENKGFIETAEGKEILHSPIPDYLFPGIRSERLATSVAGLVGTLLTLGVIYIIGKGLSRKESRPN